MKKIVKKWEGGAKKHGGFGKAMGVQIDKWIQSPEEQAKEIREAEELRQRLENERLAKEAEELRQRLENERLAKEAEELRQRLENERLTREAEELRQRLENERLAKEVAELRQRLENERLAKEVAELRQRLENERLAKEAAAEREKLVQEQSRQVVEVSKKHAEELEQVVLAKKLSKESFEKSQIEKIGDFLSRSEDVSDEAAFPAMDIVKNWTSTYAELIEKLHDFGDEALDKFLNSVEIAGDSSF
ncbi:MAG: hypothetical protein J0M23_02560 [Rickettsiales bacterium]|nr:hypothetical protein [Rickettsiales bacterium]